MIQVRVLLCRTGGWISRAIRWQTRSHWNHAALLFQEPEGPVVIESSYPKGVHMHSPWQYDGKQEIQVHVITHPHLDYDRCKSFAMAQLGKRYDLGSVVRFVTRSDANRRSAGVWFCSELVFAAVAHGGLGLFKSCEPWEISPGMLNMSPYLIYECTYPRS
jgi:uncharacterized protein YycO